jgi:anti-sigma B factor antagonist
MDPAGPDVTIENNRDVRVISIGGSLIDRISVEHVGERIADEVARQDHPKVVICFDRIKEVSSAILGTVLKIDKDIRQKHGRLALSGMNHNVSEVFRLTRLDTILEIHSTTDEAVNSFD